MKSRNTRLYEGKECWVILKKGNQYLVEFGDKQRQWVDQSELKIADQKKWSIK